MGVPALLHGLEAEAPRRGLHEPPATRPQRRPAGSGGCWVWSPSCFSPQHVAPQAEVTGLVSVSLPSPPADDSAHPPAGWEHPHGAEGLPASRWSRACQSLRNLSAPERAAHSRQLSLVDMRCRGTEGWGRAGVLLLVQVPVRDCGAGEQGTRTGLVPTRLSPRGHEPVCWCSVAGDAARQAAQRGPAAPDWPVLWLLRMGRPLASAA